MAIDREIGSTMSGSGPRNTKQSTSTLDTLVEVSRHHLNISATDRTQSFANHNPRTQSFANHNPSLGTLPNSTSVQEDKIMVDDYHTQDVEYAKEVADVDTDGSGKSNKPC